jgi:hypothetical protein
MVVVKVYANYADTIIISVKPCMFSNIDDDFSFLDKSKHIPIVVVVNQVTPVQSVLVDNTGKTVYI